MLWLLLSKLGEKYRIAGYGKLLADWPEVPGGPFSTPEKTEWQPSASPTAITIARR
jgi:hypothetical protein